MGRTKHALEDKVEKACTCSGEEALHPGGISLYKYDHEPTCPSRQIIEEEVP